MMKTLEVECPACKTTTKWQTYTKINGATDPQLKTALLHGEVFRFECPECGLVRQIELPFVYQDETQQLIIALLPSYKRDDIESDQAVINLLETTDTPVNEFPIRVVHRAPELIEKIQIKQAGYDDRLIEIVKIFTDGIFANEKPDVHIHARFFYITEDQQHKLLYLTSEGQLLVDFHNELLTLAQNKFASLLATDEVGAIQCINSRWAMNLLEQK